MSMNVRALCAAALASGWCTACAKPRLAPEKSEGKAAPSLGTPAIAPSAVATSSAPAPLMSSLEPRAIGTAPCRVLRVKGAARVLGGSSLSDLAALDGKSWVELDAGAELSIRHGATSREFALQGPGRILPCRSGLEQVLVSEGGFTSSRGSGVRPGAEMWVSTPVSALHYGDADVRVRVERGALRVRVASGNVVVESSLEGPQMLNLTGPLADKRWNFKVASGERTQGCEASARKAKEGAARVLSASTAELGQLAAAQLESRRRARAECLIAETSLERVSDPGEKARLSDQVAQANQLWQGIPAMLR